MRKLVSMLLIMLVAFGVVFAAEPTDPDKNTPSAIYLKANVPEGSGIDDDITDGEDPEPDKNGGLYVLVGIPRDESKSFGANAAYTKGDLVGLQNYDSEAEAKEVTLVPENEGDTTGSIVIYYAAAAKMADQAKSFTYKVSSPAGFVLDENNNVPINVMNEKVTEKVDVNSNTAISASADDSDGVTITGNAGGTHTDYVYMAKTTLYWDKSDEYAAGDYKATISIGISAT